MKRHDRLVCQRGEATQRFSFFHLVVLFASGLGVTGMVLDGPARCHETLHVVPHRDDVYRLYSNCQSNRHYTHTQPLALEASPRPTYYLRVHGYRISQTNNTIPHYRHQSGTTNDYAHAHAHAHAMLMLVFMLILMPMLMRTMHQIRCIHTIPAKPRPS